MPETRQNGDGDRADGAGDMVERCWGHGGLVPRTQKNEASYVQIRPDTVFLPSSDLSEGAGSFEVFCVWFYQK